MSDKRPVELTSYIKAASETNDAQIAEALGKLEDPKTRGKRKLTVSSLCALTELSRNTIRNRPWALNRLKAIKQKCKGGQAEQAEGRADAEDEGAILDGLRKRIKHILEQNGLLYEEMVSQRDTIKRKDAEIEELKARKVVRM